MPRNVEIKAKIGARDFEGFLTRVRTVSGSEGRLLRQEDTFFNSPNGRLKLRQCQDANAVAQLIFYNRPNKEGPKMSDYTIAEITDVENLKMTLSEALGVKAVVKKNRHLFLVGQTRIHVDQIHGLGNFMELEVVLQEHETMLHGEKIAESLMEELGITKDDLLSTAYADMLLDN